MVQEKHDVIGIMISLMRSKRASNRVVEVGANVIAADARLSARILEAKAESKLGDRIFDVLQFGESMLSECNTIAIQFNEGLSTEMVCERLNEMIKRIDEIRV